MSDPAAQPDIDPAKAHLVREWKYEPSPLISCRFDPLGRYIVAGAQDQRVLRLTIETGEFLPWVGHDSWVRAMGFSPDGASCWTGGYDGRLMQWELAAAEPHAQRNIPDAHKGWIRSLAVSSDGSRLATGGNDHLVKLWNTQDGQVVHTLQGHDRHVYSVAFHPDGQSLFSADLRGVIKVWDCASGAEKQAMEAKQLFTPNPGQGAEYGGVRSMTCLPADHQLVCAGLHNGTNPFGAVQDPLVVIVDYTTGQTVRIHTGKDAPKAICWRALPHPAGFLLGGCGGSAGGFVCFWNSTSETDFHRFALPNILLDLDLHPDGRQLVTAHYDHHLRLSSLTSA